MADKTRDVVVREDDEDRPRQTVRRMPDNQPDVGPYFPSGRGADEAALAGATAGMSDRDLETLREAHPDADIPSAKKSTKKDDDGNS